MRVNRPFLRSIPAPAGEPRRTGRHQQRNAVYPRACGGTPPHWTASATERGLSPRLRGNHDVMRVNRPFLRSIPAPAGEPRRTGRHQQRNAVYPRACGGTPPHWTASATERGLSPRLRGNHDVMRVNRPFLRSIPAPAGEPRRTGRHQQRNAVYPRACGGTPPHWTASATERGLSPRLRGNHDVMRVNRPFLRSIPAPAGEPRRTGRHQQRNAVYPRACGEPRRTGRHQQRNAVYPRACGGTMM